MNRIRNAIKIGIYAFKNPSIWQPNAFAMVKMQLDYFQQVSDEQRPRVWHIGFIDTKTKEKIQPELSVWCGIGYGNPIDRCTELALKNEELQRRIEELSKEKQNDNH